MLTWVLLRSLDQWAFARGVHHSQNGMSTAHKHQQFYPETLLCLQNSLTMGRVLWEDLLVYHHISWWHVDTLAEDIHNKGLRLFLGSHCKFCIRNLQTVTPPEVSIQNLDEMWLNQGNVIKRRILLEIYSEIPVELQLTVIKCQSKNWHFCQF